MPSSSSYLFVNWSPFCVFHTSDERDWKWWYWDKKGLFSFFFFFSSFPFSFCWPALLWSTRSSVSVRCLSASQLEGWPFLCHLQGPASPRSPKTNGSLGACRCEREQEGLLASMCESCDEYLLVNLCNPAKDGWMDGWIDDWMAQKAVLSFFPLVFISTCCPGSCGPPS